MLPDALEQYRQPEYTGENRCLPCTVVNVGIALVVSALASFVGTPLLGLLALGGSLLSIYLRGYLVPGTPELTEAYLPDWVLAAFDKGGRPPRESEPDLPSAGDEEPEETGETGTVDETTADEGSATTAGSTDPESLLFELDAIRETADGDDVELTDAFAERLRDAAAALRDDESERATALAGLLGVDADDVAIEPEIHGPAFYADEERVHRWPSDAALLADASAQRALGDRAQWAAVQPERRLGIARALRSFLSTCPVCGGTVGLTEETVSSCCRAWDVIAVRCGDCEAHFLELEPSDIDDGEGELVEESEGARGVSGGFVR